MIASVCRAKNATTFQNPSTVWTGQVRRRSGGPERAQAMAATTRPPITERIPPNTSGGASSSPTLIAVKVDPHASTSSAIPSGPVSRAGGRGVDTDLTVRPNCVIVTES